MRPRLLAPLLLLLVACSGPEADDVVLEEDAATSLAQHAQRLAVFLEEQEPCQALTTADELRTRARDGVSAGTVPADVANEVEAVLEEVTGSLTCDEGDEGEAGDGDDGEDPTPDDPGANDGSGGDGSDGDGSGGDGDAGGESDQEGDDEGSPERGPEGEGPPGQDDEDAPGGDGEGGPEGNGPPGQTEAAPSGHPGQRT